MARTEELAVLPEEEGQRLDRFLAGKMEDLTRTAVEKLTEAEAVQKDGKPLAKSYRVKAGDRILVTIPDPVSADVLPEEIPLAIVYEDEDLLVVNKPKGMVVHPAAGNPSGTLVNALLAHCRGSLSGIGGVIRPGIVHRIDKNTSGLLIVAKNDFAHLRLAEQIKAHTFTRTYEAVVYGSLREDSGTVDAPIGRHPVERKKMAVTQQHSRSAVTHYEVLARYPGFTHVRLRLETGRTHQIRVHMAYLGHPVAGDEVYGPKKVLTELHGQCLHAKSIGFAHPRDGRWMEFDSELPSYFTAFLEKLRRKAGGERGEEA